MSSDLVFLDKDLTNGLDNLELSQPEGTFKLTPASYILIKAIVENKDLLSGIGIDWGCGIGCMSILAAKINTVEKVYGLEISRKNLEISKKNAEINDVDNKTAFILSDSYVPFDTKDNRLKENLGKINFVLANPPSSEGDDGFGYRREVLNGAVKFLADKAVIFLNVSYQYGHKRIEDLYKNTGNFTYKGVIATTEWVPFDLENKPLLNCLKTYVSEEKRGGFEYSFYNNSSDSKYLNAQKALEYFNNTGESPLTKWQTHMFEFRKDM